MMNLPNGFVPVPGNANLAISPTTGAVLHLANGGWVPVSPPSASCPTPSPAYYPGVQRIPETTVGNALLQAAEAARCMPQCAPSPVHPTGAYNIPNVVTKFAIPRQTATISKTFYMSQLYKNSQSYALLDPQGNFSVIQPGTSTAAPTDVVDMADWAPVVVDVSQGIGYVIRCGKLWKISASDLSEGIPDSPLGALFYTYVNDEGALFTIPDNPDESSFESLFATEGNASTTPFNGLNSNTVLGLPAGSMGYPAISFLANFQVQAEIAGATKPSFVVLGVDAYIVGGPSGVAGYLLGSGVLCTPLESNTFTHVFSDSNVNGWLNGVTITGASTKALTVALYVEVLNSQSAPLSGQTVQWSVTSAVGTGTGPFTTTGNIGPAEITNSKGIPSTGTCEGTVVSLQAQTLGAGQSDVWTLQALVNGILFPNVVTVTATP